MPAGSDLLLVDGRKNDDASAKSVLTMTLNVRAGEKHRVRRVL